MRFFLLRHPTLLLVITPAIVLPQLLPGQISVSDAMDEGQEAWEIVTPAATYLYHKEGAGFSSIIDRHGFDWIEYHPGGGPEGEFRGIPNMVFNSNGNFFHPGHAGDKGSHSALRLEADRVTLTSRSKIGKWACTWEIFATHATQTVTRAGGVYWFLYEGTPGGQYDPGKDWYLTSDGIKRPVSEDRVGDLPDPEYVVFGEEGLETVFFVAQHEADDVSDTYMDWGAMTVFGFGRAGRDDYIPKHEKEGMRFSIGFLEMDSPEALWKRIGELIAPPQNEGNGTRAKGE